MKIEYRRENEYIMLNVSYLTGGGRSRLLDSVKGLLICLVVFGHCLSICDYDSIMWIRNIIYSFHMPMFVFISGYLTSKHSAEFHRLLKLLETFLVVNLYYTVFTRSFSGDLHSILTPHWICWYLLSLFFWRASVRIMPMTPKNPFIIVGILASIALLIGFIPFVEYPFSLSRTVVLSPFFYSGYYMNQHGYIESLRDVSLCKSGMSAFVLVCAIILSGFDFEKVFAASWPYRMQPLAQPYACLMRGFFFLAAAVISLFVFRGCPVSRFLASLGRHTLLIYIYHGFFIIVCQRLVRRMDLHLSSSLLCILVASTIVAIIWMTRNWKIHRYIINPVSTICSMK